MCYIVICNFSINLCSFAIKMDKLYPLQNCNYGILNVVSASLSAEGISCAKNFLQLESKYIAKEEGKIPAFIGGSLLKLN